MLSLPLAAEPLFMSFSIAFTQPSFQRILLLANPFNLATVAPYESIEAFGPLLLAYRAQCARTRPPPNGALLAFV